MKVNSMVTVMAMMQNRQYLGDGVGADDDADDKEHSLWRYVAQYSRSSMLNCTRCTNFNVLSMMRTMMVITNYHRYYQNCHHHRQLNHQDGHKKVHLPKLPVPKCCSIKLCLHTFHHYHQALLL